MRTAVDSSVIIDVFSASPHVRDSLRAIARCRREGELVACPVVWSEVAGWFERPETMQSAFARMRVRFDDFGIEAALAAGESWRRYRAAGGPRERLVADFLIGAHALTRADRLLTRDRGFHRRYFPDLAVLDPTGS